MTRQETRAGVTATITEDASGILAVCCAACGEALVDDDRGPFYDADTDDGTAHVCKWKCGDCSWTGPDGAQHERDTQFEHFTMLDRDREQLLAARAACKSARYPEQHRDDCAWCAHVLARRGPL